MNAESSTPLLFEVSWEVCNQIGGIYTVLKSKAASVVGSWRDRYCLLGPYNPHTAPVEIDPCPPPEPLKEVLQVLEADGFRTHFGRWLIAGRPYVLLFELGPQYQKISSLKHTLWRDHHISTPPYDEEVHNAVALGFAVGDFFSVLTQHLGSHSAIAHFHEWNAGVGALRLQHLNLPVATIFTTHATLLGRYMAGNRPSFYEELDRVNPDVSARHYNIEARHKIEAAAAKVVDFFTTISDLTAYEAERFLNRKADGLLPNGINVSRLTQVHEVENLHEKFKQKIHEFTLGHFFPCYTFDLDRTLYIFISGRYEYRNKGMDVFIDAMARVNHELKRRDNPPTIVAFVVTRAPTQSFQVAALHQHSMLEELKNVCLEAERGIAAKILRRVATKELPDFEELLPEEFRLRLRRAMHAFRAPGQPLIVTHQLVHEGGDAVLQHLRRCGLFNAASDPVKVVYHPDFLTATSPLLSLDYEDFVRGCHLGIFPSYYEPWGYTPLECLALGIPTITSDLTGFGQFAERQIEDCEANGIEIVRRRGRGYDDVVGQVASRILRFASLSRRDRVEMRNRSERTSCLFDWARLISYYNSIYERAITCARERRV